jgi:carbonic anhydrase
MSLVSDILSFNQSFVDNREYEAYRTDRFPEKRLVIVTCMDTRLVELLPRAMNFRNGDVKIVKNAGAVVSHPFGSAMRSVLVAVYDLHAEEIAVVGHHGCGMAGLSCGHILEKARQRGVSDDVIHTLRAAGIDLEQWLTGFDQPEDGVRQSVQVIRQHPLLPKGVPVHGMMISPETGKLELMVDGYAAAKP